MYEDIPLESESEAENIEILAQNKENGYGSKVIFVYNLYNSNVWKYEWKSI